MLVLDMVKVAVPVEARLPAANSMAPLPPVNGATDLEYGVNSAGDDEEQGEKMVPVQNVSPL